MDSQADLNPYWHKHLKKHYLTPGLILFAVVSLFMVSSAVNLLIAFENDDIIADFVTFFLKDGEPQMKTAHGTMMSYWDGLVHYGIWLMILAAVSWG